MALTFRDNGTSGRQIEVRSQDVPVGHIGKEMFGQLAGSGARWRWHLKMPSGAWGFASDGEANTVDEAKGQVEDNWQAWLSAAGLSERT